MTAEHTRRDVLRGVACGCCAAVLGACETEPDEPPLNDLAATPRRTVLGTVDDLTDRVRKAGGVLHLSEHRIYLVAWQPRAGFERHYADSAAGLLALAQKCPHLGCRIPWCESSEWFECPCHGTRLNRAGEYRFGPAPTGQIRYPLSVTPPPAEELVVQLGRPIAGAPRGTDTIEQDAAGPHCVG